MLDRKRMERKMTNHLLKTKPDVGARDMKENLSLTRSIHNVLVSEKCGKDCKVKKI